MAPSRPEPDATTPGADPAVGATSVDVPAALPDADSADPDNADTDSADTDSVSTTGDDLRERYRQALARKQGHGSGTSTGGSTPGAAGRPGGTGPAKAQRTFRRKSGG